MRRRVPSEETIAAIRQRPESLAAHPGWGVERRQILENAERPYTILVLESMEINRTLLRGMLHSEGYRLLEAASIPDALGALEQDKVDLVIMELMIPGGGGLEFCRMMKANR